MYLKRLFDCLLAIIFLVLLLPVLLLIALLLFLVQQESPLFIQKRAGLGERVFNLIKFRTMNSKTDHKGKLLPDEERLTPLGQVLRQFSLDEMPQLINVLAGDMSLVGPRPLLVQYLALYDANQKRRHEVRPGLTGWAQVNGRNNLPWKERFEYDVYYVDHLNMKLDFKILLLTAWRLFQRTDVNQKGQSTMKPFEGN